MALRFAILQEVKVGESTGEKVVLEYNEQQVLARLQARVCENLAGSTLKRYCSKQQVTEAIEKAFIDLISEFKEKTVALT